MLILQSSKTLKECEISQKFLSYDIIYILICYLSKLIPGNILLLCWLTFKPMYQFQLNNSLTQNKDYIFCIPIM